MISNCMILILILITLHCRIGLNSELQVSVKWFEHNGLVANPEKFKLLIIGEANMDFSFEVDDQRIKKVVT